MSNCCEQAGCAPSRVLVKVPATWEGIEATRQLEAEGIRCLVTLVTSTVQARAVMDAGATILATCKSQILSTRSHSIAQRSLVVVVESQLQALQPRQL
jgi:transaldolase